MPGTDANNARWFMLREGVDFEPRTTGADSDLLGPLFEDDTLFFDDDRRALELLPTLPVNQQRPLRGWASAHLADGRGETYLVPPQSNQLVIRYCDGSEAPFPCDTATLRCPTGLAFDRRGYLYIADAGQRAVIVIDPTTRHIEARLTTPPARQASDAPAMSEPAMSEPVDVVVSRAGHIYIADRRAGRIFIFDSRFNPAGSFIPANADNLPQSPRPVAITIDPDGNLLIADARHPRLLRFTPAGEPRGDVNISTAREAHAQHAPSDTCPPRAPACSGPTCANSARPLDTVDTLLFAHRDYRLRGLNLQSSFNSTGAWQSAILDSRKHNTTWHRLEFELDLPANTAITIQTATSNDRDELIADPAWSPTDEPEDPAFRLDARSLDTDHPSLLIHSPPGRYLRIRLALTGNGRGTPTIRAIRVLFPRNSYLDSLPAIYRRAMGPDRFIEDFLAIPERTLTRLEDRYEDFSRQLDPSAAPPQLLDWLAGLLDLAFDPQWPEARRRALLLRINQLYALKGTPRGLREYIKAYTGLDAAIDEHFLRRPRRPTYLGGSARGSHSGAGGFILGVGSLITTAHPDRPPDEELIGQFAHRFDVRIYLPTDEAVTRGTANERALSVVDRIVQFNKPAHTVHRIIPVYPGASVGAATRVGVDFVLTARPPHAAHIGDCAKPSTPTSTLDEGLVLSDTNPAFPRPRGFRL